MPAKEIKQSPAKKHKPDNPSQQYVGPEFFTPSMMEAAEVKTLLSWEAASRPYRKKDIN